MIQPFNNKRRRTLWLKSKPSAESKTASSEIAPFKKRMSWKFCRISSDNADFNLDFNASFTASKSGAAYYAKIKTKIDELQSVNAFYRDKNSETLSHVLLFTRGIDLTNTTYNFLDLTAKGADENPETTQDRVRFHDEYNGAAKDCCA
jgi:predicted dithiol-disulfide oxidoreductase (DUF899 family)